MMNEITRPSEMWLQLARSHNAYAIVDGAQWPNFLMQLNTEKKSVYYPLFKDMPEQEAMSHGPILLKTSGQTTDMNKELIKMQNKRPSVIWVISELSLTDLVEQLYPKLYPLDEHKEALLLRFYDPRVLYGLPKLFTKTQWVEFMEGIDLFSFWYATDGYSNFTKERVSYGDK